MDLETVLTELRKMVDADTSEAKVHAFLEAHPLLLLAALQYWNTVGDVIITQFPFGADFRADFAFLTYSNTHGLWLHLVELEPPSLHLFTSSDEFTAAANHAFQQLHDWASWCNSHRESLLHTLAPLVKRTPGSSLFFNISCVLIAGRRWEVSTPRRQERLTTRANLQRGYIRFNTWDGFIERADTMRPIYEAGDEANVRCVSYKTQGLFEKYICGDT
jgi:hypothetical protein